MKNYFSCAILTTKSKTKIPLSASTVSAGDPAEVVDDYEMLDVSELITGGREGIQGCRVDGDSMREDIKPGDYVFYDPYLRPENGDTVVSRINGKNNIKILKQTRKGLYLVPKNKTYDKQAVTMFDEFQILGVVTWHLSCDKKR